MIDPHPWTLIHTAIHNGDEAAAREALANADSRLTGRMRISADQSIKRAFPEPQKEFKSAAAKQAEQNEASSNSEVAAVIARRNEERRKRAETKFKNSKSSIGWNVPPKDGVEYTKPDRGGFNLPR
jgi:hypothetical protein